MRDGRFKMVSGFLLVLTWFLMASVLSQEPALPKRIIPAISFAASQSLLFLLYLFLIPLGVTASAKLLLAVYALCGVVFFAVRPHRLGLAAQSVRHFLQLQQPIATSMGESAILRRTLIHTSKAKIVVMGLTIGILLLCSILMASPSSWDSYTYNLSRIAHMLIRRSPFVAESPSLPQAIFPMGHDLLYTPDILFGNLRGLGIVNALGFIILLGSAINICDLLSKQGNQPQPKVASMLEMAKLITMCLLISSDQQIFQAISSKNDLVITVYFVMSCFIALTFLREKGPWSLSSVIGCALLLTLYAATCKIYGLICVVPFVLLGLLKFRTFRSPQPLGHARNKTFLLYLLSTALVIFLFIFHSFSQTAYSHLAEYQSSVGNKLNRYGESLYYGKAAVLNGMRFLLSFAVYPYSTWLKPQATSPDDYWLGLSPIVQLLSRDHFAISKGYVFRLIRERGEDFSLTSPLVHLAALLTLASLTACLLVQKKGKKREWSYVSSLRSVLDLKGIGLILIASLASSLLFFAVLSYHNWYAKYLGFSYVPLIPILSWLLVVNTVELCSSLGVSLDRLSKSPLLPAFRAVLIVVALAFMTGSISEEARFLSWSIAPGASTNKSYQLYYEYLYSTGLKSREAQQRFISQFKGQHTNQSGEKINLCFGEETPSLAPLLELAKRNPDSEAIGLFPLGPKGCSPPPGVVIVGKTIVLP